jgi:hypothetical protein
MLLEHAMIRKEYLQRRFKSIEPVAYCAILHSQSKGPDLCHGEDWTQSSLNLDSASKVSRTRLETAELSTVCLFVAWHVRWGLHLPAWPLGSRSAKDMGAVSQPYLLHTR